MFVYRLKKNTSNVMLTKSNIDQIVSLEIALKKDSRKCNEIIYLNLI